MLCLMLSAALLSIRRTHSCSVKSMTAPLFPCHMPKALVGRTNIAYIETHEGWLYLAAVTDLYSRNVVGWSIHSRMQTMLVINALLMAVWRRKPTSKIIIHSDQGSQYTSAEWLSFLKAHNQEAKDWSRRGNCYDNAVAESFFHLLKTERIRRNTYKFANKFVRTCSIKSNNFTIRNAVMLTMGSCHPSNLR